MDTPDSDETALDVRALLVQITLKKCRIGYAWCYGLDQPATYTAVMQLVVDIACMLYILLCPFQYFIDSPVLPFRECLPTHGALCNLSSSSANPFRR